MSKKQVVYVNIPKGVGKVVQGKETKPQFEGKKQPLSEEDAKFVKEMQESKR